MTSRYNLCAASILVNIEAKTVFVVSYIDFVMEPRTVQWRKNENSTRNRSLSGTLRGKIEAAAKAGFQA